MFEKIIEGHVEKLKGYNVKSIVLFGSVAKGEIAAMTNQMQEVSVRAQTLEN